MLSQAPYSEFCRLAKQGNVIPVWMELPADLETPVSVFLKLGSDKSDAFLLESVELGERLGRYSFIGTHPDTVFEYSNNTSRMLRSGRLIKKTTEPLLDTLERFLSQYRLVHDPRLPAFGGGLVGYLGYELVAQFEDIRLKTKPGLSIPDAVLFFSRNFVVFDHIKHHLKLIHLAIVNHSPKKAHANALRELKRLELQVRKPLPPEKPASLSWTAPSRLRSNLKKTDFLRIVKRAKEYIRAGDCIQVVLSQRFDLGKIRNDFSVYRILRSLNPSPYMFFFKYGRLTLVGSSPEMLTRKTGRLAEVRPIAGTRPRGITPDEDFAYETALKHSAKEMAEHLMLVDLGRNDLGRVAEKKSVRVENFARVERYSHVMHLVSDVQAKLKHQKNSLDLLRSTFPAGTVTGAPKIRAMQIIDELEPQKRGPYAGSLGYFSLSGDLDMCITIRTIVIHRRHAYVQAGAGIVNDSKPENEFKETQNKAKALLQAVAKTKTEMLS